MRLLGFAAVVAAALLGPSGSLAAADEAPHGNVVEIFNHTPFVLLRLYAHYEGSSDWSEDELGNRFIEPGKSLKLDFNLGPNRCRHDLTVELVGIHEETFEMRFQRFDACRETELHVRMNSESVTN